MSSSPSLDWSQDLERPTDSSESINSLDSSEIVELRTDPTDDTVENNPRAIAPTQETKRRKTITHEIVSMVVRQISRKDRPTIKVISENVGLARSTVLKLLRELREGKYDYGDFVVYRPTKKGRKTVITEELCERVRDILTSSPTETIDSAK